MLRRREDDDEPNGGHKWVTIETELFAGDGTYLARWIDDQRVRLAATPLGSAVLAYYDDVKLIGLISCSQTRMWSRKAVRW